jgi:hypothetical protein
MPFDAIADCSASVATFCACESIVSVMLSPS